MNNKERIEEAVAFMDKVIDRLALLREKVKETYDNLAEHTVKEKKGNIRFIAAKSEIIEAHWDALMDFKTYMEGLIQVVESIHKSGDLKKCNECLSQISESLKKYNSTNGSEN